MKMKKKRKGCREYEIIERIDFLYRVFMHGVKPNFFYIILNHRYNPLYYFLKNIVKI